MRDTDCVEEAEHPLQSTLKRQFFEVIDLLNNELTRRFDQPGMKLAASREQYVIHVIQGKDVSPHYLDLPHWIPPVELQQEESTFKTMWEASEQPRSLIEVVKKLKTMDLTTLQMTPNMVTLVRLCLTSPASVANCERSFSTLRRLKTWTRNRISQKRLTWLSVLNTHKEMLDNIDQKALMKLFVMKTPERRCVFGEVS